MDYHHLSMGAPLWCRTIHLVVRSLETCLPMKEEMEAPEGTVATTFHKRRFVERF